jgi:hypothetical protein
MPLDFGGCQIQLCIVDFANCPITRPMIRALIFFSLIFSACGGAGTSAPFQMTNRDRLSNLDPPGQELAFGALNEIQVNTPRNHFYSGFLGSGRPKEFADTCFLIAASEWRGAIAHFLDQHCPHLPTELQTEWAHDAALAQQEYTICQFDRQQHDDHGRLPMTGTWVLHNVGSQRDITVVW